MAVSPPLKLHFSTSLISRIFKVQGKSQWLTGSLVVLLFAFPFALTANVTKADSLFRAARLQVANQPELALEMANEIIRDYGYLRNDSLMAKVAYLMGTANLYLGRGFMAAEHFKHALTYAYMEQNIALKEASWNNLGIAYDIEGKLESSLEAYHHSLEIASLRNDSTSIMQSIINIGLLDRKSGNYERAIEIFEQALHYFSQQNDSLNMGLCYQNLGSTYIDLRQPEAAEPYKLKALECFRAAQYRMGQIENKINLANLYREMGQYAKAISFIDSALEVNRNYGNKSLEGNIYNHLAAIQIQQRNYRQAENSVTLAMKICEEYPNLEFQIFTAQTAMRLYAHTGNIQKYQEVEAQYGLYSAELQSQRNINAYNQLTELYKHQENIALIEEQQIKILNKNRSIAFLSALLLVLMAIIAVVVTLYLRISRYQRLLFQQRVHELKEIEVAPVNEENEAEEYDKFRELYRSIQSLLERKKMYTDSSLNVGFVANELNTNEKYISTAISRYGDTTFSGLVNRYRINEACRLLLDSEKGYKMGDVARLAGYNDPSTFYRNFKESTGLTPLQFVKLKPQTGLVAAEIAEN